MSSVVSSNDAKVAPSTKNNMLKTDEKRLVRTSSIEKIKRFNSMICSQQYLILPALLGLLKTSQPTLQLSADKTLLYFDAILCRFYLAYLINVTKKLAVNVQQSVKDLPDAILRFYQIFRRNLESTLALTCAVYSAMALVILQMFLLSYYLRLIVLPVGFSFLFSCMVVIQYLNFKTTFFFLRSHDRSDKGDCKKHK
ncbi:unnamed protein product [Acanthoscelides obtectus]|uniref:Uncharacterized protein n=1 Tax=Acanthoscelides obtectus TaxID=200917 RepID=A0A9P0L1X8_ACAOB|nr:unnamed protein product [Acanthoscelides obtectus]CAK1659916.1 hypothetical protein AOBTE_LOCUS21752 [Acanthoscelides obtectus]